VVFTTELLPASSLVGSSVTEPVSRDVKNESSQCEGKSLCSDETGEGCNIEEHATNTSVKTNASKPLKIVFKDYHASRVSFPVVILNLLDFDFCYSAPVEVWTVEYCDKSACVCLGAYLWNRWSNLHQFLCTSPVALAQSFSGGIAIRYILPVLWMTSCLA